MVNFFGVNYSLWTNNNAYQMAKKVDKDGTDGLQGTETFAFAQEAKANNVEKDDFMQLMGLETSQTRAADTAFSRGKSEDFDKAVDFYNKEMDYSQRRSVTSAAEDAIYQRLYALQKEIDNAYINCAAFNDSDMMVVRMSPYRYYTYPRFYDRLLNFDVADIRKRTTANMDSLNEIRDQVEKTMAKAKGETEYTKPEKFEYDVDAIAQKLLGMSYEEFAKQYPDELEKCKYVTYADLRTMSETESYVYGKAKAYAAEMLETTLQTAHNVHWDIQEQLLYESLNTSADIFAISEFEYDGITDKGLDSIKSYISFDCFESALMDKYGELKKEEKPDTAINAPEAEAQIKKPVKKVINGKVYVFTQDGSVYNLNGEQIK